MANPQIENGFIMIATEIMEALIKINLSGQEIRSVLFVIRKTYGFKKKNDFIALSQFAKMLNISKIRASQIIKVLENRKILTVTKNINGIGKEYRFNKNFEEWKRVNKNINRIEKDNKGVKKNLNRPLRKTLTTKDNITIDTITKEKRNKKEIFDFFNNLLFKEFNFRTKQKADIYQLIKDYGCFKVYYGFRRASLFYAEIKKNKWKISYGENWTKIYENFNFFISDRNLKENIEKVNRWNKKEIPKDMEVSADDSIPPHLREKPEDIKPENVEIKEF
jgi:phage replication O-like protein O